ncbi:MAG: acyl-CoA dehydrogenase family protein [Alphaproteobacteria bacterium]
MIPRTLFSEEHEIFRQTVRRFVEQEVVPHHAKWEKSGVVPRDVWLKAGATGMLLCSIPEEYGGLGGDVAHSMIVIEELTRVGATGPGFALHSDIVAPYLLHYGSEAQKKAWLPKMASGEYIGAIAMTEPSVGSDLQNITTRAIRDGDHYVVNGQKIYISNGQSADIIIVACKTDPTAKGKGVSLVVVEATRKGFVRGRNLEKIGFKAQDTSELFFQDVRVPVSNLLGEEGRGFTYLMEQLTRERIIAAARNVALMEAALEWTVEFTKGRTAFGRPIFEFQNTRFKLAEVKTHCILARIMLDRCTELLMQGKLDSVDAAMIKYWSADTANDKIDDCLQLHGGAGFMWEYPIGRAFVDVRQGRIAGGTSEIMKEIISRTL